MTATADEARTQAQRLRAERRPFVSATVVRAERPTSARAGDAAVVLEDGTILGFVGGECAEASVQAQALTALASGEPVLLRITPDADPAEGPAGTAGGEGEPGTVTVQNPCLSGGTLEVFLEPTLPPPLVVVHGDAPIARAVRGLAGWLGWDVRPWGDESHGAAGGTDAVVVASHGGDEHAVLAAALADDVPYVGLVASPRRGAAVLAALDVPDDRRARVSTPAGLDIGARSPEEVALSILAEIVDRRPRPRRRSADPQQPAGAAAATAVDPVCGMTVAAVDATRHVDHAGTRYRFCGSGCEEAFRADPAAFVRP